MPSLVTLLTDTSGMTSDGNRMDITGQEIKRRRLALNIDTPARLAQLARVSTRATQKAERDEAGPTVLRKLGQTLDRLEAGEIVVEDEPDEFLTVEFRPGVWVAVRADDAATLGDLREVEEKIRRLADNGR